MNPSDVPKTPLRTRGSLAFRMGNAQLNTDQGLIPVTPSLTAPPSVPGLIGNAAGFDGLSGYKLTGGAEDLAHTDCAVVALVNVDPADISAVDCEIISAARADGGNALKQYSARLRGASASVITMSLHWTSGTTAGSVSQNFGISPGWHLFTFTRRPVQGQDAFGVDFYVDGQRAAQSSTDRYGDLPGGALDLIVGHTIDGAGAPTAVATDIEVDTILLFDRWMSFDEHNYYMTALSASFPQARALLRRSEPSTIDGRPAHTVAEEGIVRRRMLLYADMAAEVLALADDITNTMLPTRAYGDRLERWEELAGETPTAVDRLEDRQGRMGQVFGQNPDLTESELENALSNIRGVTSVTMLPGSNDHFASDLANGHLRGVTYMNCTPATSVALDIAVSQERIFPHTAQLMRIGVSTNWKNPVYGGITVSGTFPTISQINNWHAGLFFRDYSGNVFFWGTENNNLVRGEMDALTEQWTIDLVTSTVPGTKLLVARYNGNGSFTVYHDNGAIESGTFATSCGDGGRSLTAVYAGAFSIGGPAASAGSATITRFRAQFPDGREGFSLSAQVAGSGIDEKGLRSVFERHRLYWQKSGGIVTTGGSGYLEAGTGKIGENPIP